MAFSDQLDLPSPLQHYISELHKTYASLRTGKVADYIPELSKADKDCFGICLIPVDGHVYKVGETDQQFTIQSISKPFVYGLALENHGEAAVTRHVGVEPTGDAFNAISLDPIRGIP